MKRLKLINLIYPQSILHHYTTFLKFFKDLFIKGKTLKLLESEMLLFNSLTVTCEGQANTANEYKGFIIVPLYSYNRLVNNLPLIIEPGKKYVSEELKNGISTNLANYFPTFIRFINLKISAEEENNYLALIWETEALKKFLFDYSEKYLLYYRSSVKSLPAYVKAKGIYNIANKSFTVTSLTQLKGSKLKGTQQNLLSSILTAEVFITTLINISNDTVSEVFYNILKLLYQGRDQEITLSDIDVPDEGLWSEAELGSGITSIQERFLENALSIYPLDISFSSWQNNPVSYLTNYIDSIIDKTVGLNNDNMFGVESLYNIGTSHFTRLWYLSSLEEKTVLYFILVHDLDRRYELWNPGDMHKLTLKELTTREANERLILMYNVCIIPPDKFNSEEFNGIDLTSSPENIYISGVVLGNEMLSRFIEKINFMRAPAVACNPKDDIILNMRYIFGIVYQLNYYRVFNDMAVYLGEEKLRFLNIMELLGCWVHASSDEQAVITYLLSLVAEQHRIELLRLLQNSETESEVLIDVNIRQMVEYNNGEISYLTFEQLLTENLEPAPYMYKGDLTGPELGLYLSIDELLYSYDTITLELEKARGDADKVKYTNLLTAVKEKTNIYKICKELKIFEYFNKKYNYTFAVKDFLNIMLSKEALNSIFYDADPRTTLKIDDFLKVCPSATSGVLTPDTPMIPADQIGNSDHSCALENVPSNPGTPGNNSSTGSLVTAGGEVAPGGLWTPSGGSLTGGLDTPTIGG